MDKPRQNPTEDESDRPEAARLVAELETPRAAAVAGLAFAVMMSAIAVILHSAVPPGGDQVTWISDPTRRRHVAWALELVPFAGIAFLWFIGVIRARLGDREDKFFATAFLGSGLLFVAMLFTSAASVGALLFLYDDGVGVPSDEVRLVTATSSLLVASFGIRMAAVFTLVVTNLGRRTRVVPGWLQAVGYPVAGVLLFAPPRAFWAVLLFPIWVLLLSLQLLLASFRRPEQPA